MQPGKSPDTAATFEATDEELVELYFARSERAIEATEAKYGRYLRAVLDNVLDSAEDRDECLNDAYLSAWNHIPPDRPRSFPAYLTKIVRNIALDRRKEMNRKKRAPAEGFESYDELDEVLESGRTVESEVDSRLLSEYLSGFARRLPKEQRYVFLCRYYYADSVNAIAARLGLSPSAVYQMLAAIKGKLRDGLEAEGFV